MNTTNFNSFPLYGPNCSGIPSSWSHHNHLDKISLSCELWVWGLSIDSSYRRLPHAYSGQVVSLIWLCNKPIKVWLIKCNSLSPVGNEIPRQLNKNQHMVHYWAKIWILFGNGFCVSCQSNITWCKTQKKCLNMASIDCHKRFCYTFVFIRLRQKTT